ncbi:UbiD family decarboxylase domain-containing protein [Streptomyces drozdowiczii]|uniref:UbiD family decarboxylase n=1 Tax=Streptomyces drozdowiczii TaxID=202862 RepID=A0ABY6Q1R9_9ACTN|nr:UbiD family decarboxylase domain-containing protein [Streptomyces drozdowiczii]MCX0241924.1 UbiD family decarboxylase [Streptomyces drozdowiczii]UZK57964.1 UbiD family decarboxylase [Streptomyces drozdowiczii]
MSATDHLVARVLDQLGLVTDHPVDPYGELADVYKRVGAGGTVQRPTRVGPAMLFEKVKGYDGARILVGLPGPRPERPRARSVVRCECQ